MNIRYDVEHLPERKAGGKESEELLALKAFQMCIRDSFWSFQDGVCSAYDSDTTHTEDHLIMAFRILDEQEEAA